MGGHIKKIVRPPKEPEGKPVTEYRLVVELGRDPATGKRKRMYRTFATKKEAEAEMARVLEQVRRGTYTEPSEMPLSDYLNWWLRNTSNLKPATIDSYANIVRKHLAPALGAVPISKLHAVHVAEYLSKKRQQGYSARTAQYHRAVLSRALNIAVKYGLIPYNPVAAVEPPKPEGQKGRALSPEERERLLAAARDHRDYALIYTALYTGLRRGELLALRWKDVDFERGLLAVTSNRQYSKERGFYEGTPKGRKTRLVPVPETVLSLLREHRKKQVASLNRAQDLVFGDAGKPFSVSARFRTLAKKAGIVARFHDLRHTYGTLLEERGIDARTIQELLGHATLGVTESYLHPTLDMLRQAVDSIDPGRAQKGKTEGRKGNAATEPPK